MDRCLSALKTFIIENCQHPETLSEVYWYAKHLGIRHVQTICVCRMPLVQS